jgi:hypothetical protein
MNVRASLAVACLLVGQFTSGIASAQAVPTPAMTPIPRPAKPDFSTLTFLVGTWACTSKSARRPAPSTYTSTYSMDPTGYWLVVKSANAGVPWFPYAGTSTDMITYDANAKQWIDVYTDTLGNYDVSTSPGWSGNTMVWTDKTFVPARDITSQTAVTNTKVSDTSTTSTSSFTTTSGTTVGVTGACTKTQ